MNFMSTYVNIYISTRLICKSYISFFKKNIFMIFKKNLAISVDFDDFYLSQSELGRHNKYTKAYYVEKEVNDLIEILQQLFKNANIMISHFIEKYPRNKIFKKW